MPSLPPAMSTAPLPNSVAVWFCLATIVLPVAAKIPGPGSYSSALAPSPSPPTMSTVRLPNKVAV